MSVDPNCASSAGRLCVEACSAGAVTADDNANQFYEVTYGDIASLGL